LIKEQANRLISGKQYSKAEKLLRKLCIRQAGDTQAWLMLAQVNQLLGKLDKAIACYRSVLVLHADYVPARYNMTVLLIQQGRKPAAISELKALLDYAPGYFAAHFNLGVLMQESGDFGSALESFSAALKIEPTSTDALFALGNVYADTGMPDLAIEHFEKVLTIAPSHKHAGNNLGCLLMEQGRLTQARQVFEQALGNNPESAKLHWHYSHVLFKLGELLEGWQEYEWRRPYGVENREFPYALWDGSSLKGKTLLVYAEQGVGDEIMFASCLPDVIARAEQCIIECNARLETVFARSFPTAIVHGGEKNVSAAWLKAQPAVDYQLATGSLPRYFRNNIEDYPAPSAYLKVDSCQHALWQERCFDLGKGLKVGISWFGGNNEKTRKLRSIPLGSWERVLKMENVQFVNLQYGDCGNDIERVAQENGVVIHVMDGVDPLKDLESYIGLISALDLVVSVDNSTVHFAGSIGKDVVAMLPLASDWRWFGSGLKSPWYSTLKLLRQTTAVMLQSEKYTNRPIFIAGTPRSGTSLLTGCLELCGAWAGQTVPATVDNPRGFFENIELRERVVKSLLRDEGACLLGVRKLPDLFNLKLRPGLAKIVLDILVRQGYAGDRPWIFKDAKLSLLWPVFNEAFPEARWVIVRRNTEDIVRSCQNTGFMKQHNFDDITWKKWIDAYCARLDVLKKSEASCYEVEPSRIISDGPDYLRPLISDLDLVWNRESLSNFISPECWHAAKSR
jgi:Tfp pilus assembly protein PilF